MVLFLREPKGHYQRGVVLSHPLEEESPTNPEGRGNVPISQVDILLEGRAVHLRGFGWVKVFRTISQDGEAEYWASNDLEMNKDQRVELEQQGWGIETYHRGIKQCCGAERAQVRKATGIMRHLLLALRAFLQLEVYRLKTGISWYKAKLSIIRDAVRTYLAHPIYVLPSTA